VVLAAALFVPADEACAQADTDTTDVSPVTEVSPAAPDSVEADDVETPTASDTGDVGRAVVNADSLSARTEGGERIQELFRNVLVRQDTTRLESDYGRRYLSRDEVLFTDNVVVYQRGDTLRADTVRYDKSTKVGRASGNVRLTDGAVTVRAPRATYFAQNKRSIFPDRVTMVDDERVLRARWGQYWSEDRRAEFEGRVRLTDPETYMEADSLTYYRDTERSVATGNVFIRRMEKGKATRPDTTDRTYLFGEWVDNQEQRGYSRVEGRALLVQVRMDSSGAPEDTLILRSRRLDAYRSDTHRRLIAIDSVRTWQAQLAAVADSAVYDRVLETGPADPFSSPIPPPESRDDSVSTASPIAQATDSLALQDDVDPSTEQEPPDTSRRIEAGEGGPPPQRERRRRPFSDSIAANRGEAPVTTADSVSLPDTTGGSEQERDQEAISTDVSPVKWERPTADSMARLPLEETRLFGSPVTWFGSAQTWGDSIRVRGHGRTVDTVRVRGRAFAAQQDTSIDRINQLKGKTLTAFFRADSLRRIEARPNARAIRFLTRDNGELGGGARASGDKILLHFRGGEVRKTEIVGGVESTYYRKPKHIPDPFRLDGFQWTPDLRPMKKGLLDDDRARRRLGVPLEDRPIAGPRPYADTIGRRSVERTAVGESPQQSSPSGSVPVDTTSAPIGLPTPPHPPPVPGDSATVGASPPPDTTHQSDTEP